MAPKAALVFADTLHVQHKGPTSLARAKTTQSRYIIAWNSERLVGSYVILAVCRILDSVPGVPLRVLVSMTAAYTIIQYMAGLSTKSQFSGLSLDQPVLVSDGCGVSSNFGNTHEMEANVTAVISSPTLTAFSLNECN